MCRSIHTLYHTDSPASAEEIRAASLQFVRKISGYHKPSKHDEAAFMNAIAEIEAASTKLLVSLQTNAPTREHRTMAGRSSQGNMAGKTVE
jgi:hypothetical protein